jgi:arsenate reductase
MHDDRRTSRDLTISNPNDTESKCPIFPGISKRWHWPFPDPAAVSGTDAEKLEKVRAIRDTIRDWLLHPPENSLNFKALIDSY